MTTMMLLLLKPVFPYVGKYWIRNVKIFCIYIKNKSSCYPVNVLPGNILAFFYCYFILSHFIIYICFIT